MYFADTGQSYMIIRDLFDKVKNSVFTRKNIFL